MDSFRIEKPEQAYKSKESTSVILITKQLNLRLFLLPAHIAALPKEYSG
jgi:hypothetical protein